MTPAMRQYHDAKRQHPDAIVLFRMGDFYEMFFEDALTASRALELTLTSRAKDSSGVAIPMCGVPHHAADTYITRLVKRGFRVAICEQVEDPRKAKGIVRREVVRVLTPGTLTDTNYLDARAPTFLMALVLPPGAPDLESRDRATETQYGLALLDISTGEFVATEYVGPGARHALAEELRVLEPKEILLANDVDLVAHVPDLDLRSLTLTKLEPWAFGFDSAQRTLTEQLHTHGLQGFGLDGHVSATRAAGAIVQYLRDTQKTDLAHVRSLSFRERSDHLLVDALTLRHLEIIESTDGGRAGSLLALLDRTQTPSGARLLRSWLQRPLVSLERIQDRHDAVEELAFRVTERSRLRDHLKSVHDLERLVARAALGTATPRDMVALRQSLAVVPRIRTLLEGLAAPLVHSLVGQLDDVAEVRDELARTIVDEPPAQTKDGGCIRDGVHDELDDLRGISRTGKETIAAMEASERARTGINSLKVRFNRVFGYYIEISRSNLGAVPDDYQRKQTIAGGERFITPALKQYEERVLGAEERILAIEAEIFDRVRQAVAAEAARIQDTARALATLDVLAALAEAAALQNYTKPQMHESDELIVVDGRHPVVECATRDSFVPNDIELNASTHQLVILTGPNMGGKSTFLRQTALICLMAQIGSFVPARQAKLPVADRLFARVGASDNIARGQSTFMVEMQETARIVRLASSRSLVVLDEIGRGTATFDGLSIAWAVAEYLATHPTARPKTLFATHYHELTDLADAIPGVVNLHVAAREWKDEIVFLRKVVPGRSDRSYGIQVARLAGLPTSVITRATEILASLERDELARGGRPSLSGAASEAQQQLTLFQAVSPAAEHLLERIRETDVNALTPLEALNLLAQLKRDAMS